MNNNDFENDIILAKFINYMNIALSHKRIDYIKHQNYLKNNEQILPQEEWSELSNTDNLVHSFCGFYDCSRIELEKALNKLTEKQRIVIYKHYYEGKQFTLIARELNTKDDTVRQIKKRAIESLKKILKENMHE